MKKIGINKYGIKLEDHVDYASYRRACIMAAIKSYQSTKKGKSAQYKYSTSDKGKLIRSKYRSTINVLKGRRAMGAKRRSAKLQRTPAWADLEAIKQFYLNCPEGYHVDHDVPLQGENISGLHVLNNLVYLTAEDNLKKGNKWPHNYSVQNGFSSNLAIV